MTSNPQTCVLLRWNHFDPIWRRCWDRVYDVDGLSIVPYRKIEEAWLDDALSISADGSSCFLIEATWVLRHYLETHPERLETLRTLAREGRFEVLGSGENIVDSNMIHGELLARNLILGTLWAEQTLGIRPVIGWHADGFGSSAQMPQIFRECGYKWLPSISYNTPDATYWRGLDGSTVMFEVPGRFVWQNATAAEIYVKSVPCRECGGTGCPACAGRGFAQDERAEFDAFPKEKLSADVVAFILSGEEVLPGLHVTEAVERFNASTSDFAVRQGIHRDLIPFVREELDRVDNPPADQISSKVENNPCHTGCYVTRIKCKQKHRTAEHALLSAELWDTIISGGDNAESLRDIWKRMTLSAFHDAITSTHCDAANAELQDLLSGCNAESLAITTNSLSKLTKPRENTFTIFNSQAFSASAPVRLTVPSVWTGVAVTCDGQSLPVYGVTPKDGGTEVTFLSPEVTALGARTVTIGEAKSMVDSISERTVKCGKFSVEIGDHGITNVTVDGIGSIADTSKFLFGELLTEADLGDPWCTRSLDREREQLGQHTRLVGVERQGDSVVITYEGKHPDSGELNSREPRVNTLEWRQTFRLMDGVPWIDVRTWVRWYTYSLRLRLAFPSTTRLDRGVYDIPYGVIERDRYEPTSTAFANAGGDWPAVHWAGVQAPDHTFAVLNEGTPSYRVEDGVVTVSVLRSPILPACLLEPQYFVSYDYNGMMDHGEHDFHHAVYIGDGDWRENDTTRVATVFNAGLNVQPGELVASLPEWGIDAEHTMLTAIKPAEDGNGVVLRLVEMSGRPETVRVRVPKGFISASRTNLLEEDPQPLKRDGGSFLVEMGEWKIATVRVTR
jgi:alpha-mannosidase